MIEKSIVFKLTYPLSFYKSYFCIEVNPYHDWEYYGPMVISFVCISPHYHHYADALEGNGFLKHLSDTFCQVCA